MLYCSIRVCLGLHLRLCLLALSGRPVFCKHGLQGVSTQLTLVPPLKRGIAIANDALGLR